MAEDRQVDFGTFLRQAREQRGVSLQELAVTTKISARVLEALERNDPSKLPGGIFSRSFVRAYAREVGLDPDVAVASFVSAFPNESGADEMPAATSAVEAESFEQRRRILRFAARLLGVAVLVAILAFIYYSNVKPRFLMTGSDDSPPPAAATAPPPLQSTPLAPEPGASMLPAEAPADATPVAATPPAGQSETAAPAATPGVPVSSASATTAVPPDAAPSGQAPLSVVLTLAEPCWLSVSVDGTRSPSRTAGAGERLEFAVRRSITIRAGNAGALSVTLNGKAARALGTPGQVVTTTITASDYGAFLR